MKKILILNDVHYGKSREISMHPGLIKQANSTAKERLQSLIPRFNEINPDLVVQMGDVIKVSSEKIENEKNLKEVFGLLKNIKLPIIQLIGNHELKGFSRKELEKIIASDSDKKSNLFGLINLDFLQVIWLDFELDVNNRAFMSNERLEWIKSNVDKGKPLVVLSHYSLTPIDAKGSFYFEKSPEHMLLKNRNELMAIFKNLPAKVFINAHVHFVSHKQVDDRHFISSPAFSENVKAEKNEASNPGIYSVLEIDKNKFVFTSYSGQFCFAKIEGEV